jgi:tyrosinase
MERHFCTTQADGLSRALFTRADLEIYGIDHFCRSYTARIFFDPPADVPDNADERHRAYAGQFSIFGHSECLGEEGHCAPPPTSERRFDRRPSHPLTPAFKRVVVTDALRRALSISTEVPISLLVAPTDASDEEADPDPGACHARLLTYKGMQIVTFR